MALVLKGRLDAATSPELERTLKTLPGNPTELVMLFEEVDYISSAGLRVLLMAQKLFPGKAFTIRKVQPAVMEVFQATGFTSFLNIEK